MPVQWRESSSACRVFRAAVKSLSMKPRRCMPVSTFTWNSGSSLARRMAFRSSKVDKLSVTPMAAAVPKSSGRVEPSTSMGLATPASRRRTASMSESTHRPSTPSFAASGAKAYRPWPYALDLTTDHNLTFGPISLRKARIFARTASASISTQVRGGNDFFADIWLECLGDQNVALFGLIVFHDRYEGATYGEDRGVVHVDILYLAARAANARAETARLVVGHEVGGMRLAILVLRRHPGFQVNVSCVRVALVAGRANYQPVRQLQGLHEVFLHGHEEILLDQGFFGHREAFHLHFVKLVHAQYAARILAARARLAAETCGVSNISQRQPLFRNYLIHMERAERVLRAADQVQIVACALITLLFWLQAGHAFEYLRPDHDRRQDRIEGLGGISPFHVLGNLLQNVLVGQDAEGELDERELQEDGIALQISKAGAADGRGRLRVYHAQTLAKGDVVFRLEVQLGRLAPGLDDLAAHLILADRRVRARQVRYYFPDRQALHLGGNDLFLQLFDFRLKLLCALYVLGCGELFLLRALLLRGSRGRTPFLVQVQKFVQDGRTAVFVFDRLADPVGIAAQNLYIDRKSVV